MSDRAQVRTWYLQRTQAFIERADCPQVAFSAIFCVLMVLACGLPATVSGSFTFTRFVTAGAWASGIAGWVALGLSLRLRSPWLSLSATLWMQVKCCLAVASLVGACYLCYRSFPHGVDLDGAFLLLAMMTWSGLAIATSWGMVMNRWWAFFGEALVVSSLIAAYLWFAWAVIPAESHGARGTLTKLLPVAVWILPWSYVSEMTRSGFVRWNESGLSLKLVLGRFWGLARLACTTRWRASA